MNTLHVRHPWLVSIVLAAAFLAVSLLGTPIGNGIEQAWALPLNSGVVIQQFLLAVLVALAITLFGGWRAAGFFKRGSPGAWLMCLPLMSPPFILLFVTGIVVVDPVQVLMLVVFTLMIGIAEEGLFRGVLLRAFLSGGTLRAAVISSAIFGAMHLVNVFYGMNLAMAALYAFYAALLGFGFAAPYVRGGGAMWPLITTHAMFDLLGKLGHNWGAQAAATSSNEALFRLGMAIIIALYGIWLLRHAQQEQTSSPEQRPGRPQMGMPLSGASR